MYNKHDMDGFVSCFKPNVIAVKLPSNEVLLQGHDGLRIRYASRFAEGSSVHATVIHRIDLGSKIIDHEEVIGLGENPVRLAAVYEVEDGLISWVGFLYES
jgi:hypothetical protein